jgi:hypothetical protein
MRELRFLTVKVKLVSMPFAALCRICNTYLVAGKREDLSQKIRRHFQSAHDKFPQPDPNFLDASDLTPNTVYLLGDSGSRYTFASSLFCSSEYCISTITEKDYGDCSLSRRTQEFFNERLKDYFPPV